MPIKDYFFKEFSVPETNLLIVLILAFAVPLISWPANYLIRRNSKKNRTMSIDGKALRISWIITALNSILGLLLLYLILRYSPFLAKYGFDIMGRVFTHLPFYMILLTAGQILVLVFAWKHKFWNMTLRIFFSITAIYAVYFIMVLKTWNLLFIKKDERYIPQKAKR